MKITVPTFASESGPKMDLIPLKKNSPKNLVQLYRYLPYGTYLPTVPVPIYLEKWNLTSVV